MAVLCKNDLLHLQRILKVYKKYEEVLKLWHVIGGTFYPLSATVIAHNQPKSIFL